MDKLLHILIFSIELCHCECYIRWLWSTFSRSDIPNIQYLGIGESQLKNVSYGFYGRRYFRRKLRKSYSVTLTHIFKVKTWNNRLAVPADLPPLLRHPPSSCSCLITQSSSMYIPHVHISCTYLMYIPHVHSSCTYLMYIPHVHTSCTYLMYIPHWYL